MNPIARELNEIIKDENPHVMEMLSAVGKNLFFPKGILSQSAEAKEKAYRLNATIGIAKEENRIMCFDSVMDSIKDISPSESLTYAPSFGIPGLRRIWQDALYEKNTSLRGKPISLPVVTCGITNGISTFADVWIDPEDVVILPDMMWGNYSMILSVRKSARLRHYSIFTEDGRFNLNAFEEAVMDEAQQNRKITVLLNFPHNPSGYSATRDVGREIIRILKTAAEAGTHVIVATDDSYFGLFYEDDVLRESVFAGLCGLHPGLLAVKLDGCTKENFAWGLRVGFITYGATAQSDAARLYDALEKKTAGCIRGNISNASHLGQSIVLKSMQSKNYPLEKERTFGILKDRANKVKAVLADPKYQEAWDVYPFNSGYFMCIRLKHVAAEKLRVHLLEKYGVGLISIGEHNLRIAFSCLDEADIPALFDIILQGAQELADAHS